MNIEHLKYIIKIVEEGSISKAANSLFVTQPYLSKVVQTVENQLGFDIFERSNRGIKVTKKGAVFIEQASNLLRQYENLLDIKINTDHEYLKFAITTVRSSLVVESFIEFIQQYKDDEKIEFTIVESDSVTPIDDIIYQNADVSVIYSEKSTRGLLIDELASKNITYEKVCELQPSIILGTHHPLLKDGSNISLEDLYAYGYVGYTNRHYPYYLKNSNIDIVESVIDFKKIQKFIYVGNRASYHNILTQTDFFSFGTQAARRQEELFNITSIPIEDYSMDHLLEMAVLTRQGNPLQPIASDFIKLLKENYGQMK